MTTIRRLALLLLLPLITAACSAAPPPLNPATPLPTPDGGAISLAELRGETVLLNFWATWCIPCRAELPAIEAAHQRYDEQGLAVLAVNMGEEADLINRFTARIGVELPFVLDQQGELARAYQVTNLPTSIILDRDGNVVARHIGYLNEEKLQQLIEDHLPNSE